ncbi:glycosyltransferase [Myxococcus sp. SDU36]|uniref:glycosyltransferase n=1 Tax=Myxococcus sp. SDU36 TaxID=2831967 RepID=UPI002543329E|nr:glycosyltransferase [Myxococcus sp. SDU36]WIG92985.1 glycosyltransferase [Myxococcus sp. SDU36]
MILGEGREGVVRRVGDYVEKRFHRGTIDAAKVDWFGGALRGTMPFIPEPEWTLSDETWVLRYPWFETLPAEDFSLDEVRDFLLFCLEKNLVCANIKRANFRQRPGGGLTFIDIGVWIVPMNVDFFRDAAARAFALAALGWTDEELRQRSQGLREDGALTSLPGFADFYRKLLTEHAFRQWRTAELMEPRQLAPASEVTLLIKACAMDVAALLTQVRHIVGQLESPRRFARRVLLVDPFPGPFLREYAPGDLPCLLSSAQQLQREGTLDEIWIAPREPGLIAAVNAAWFGLACDTTHSAHGVPITPQLWGFDQVRTRYVLQCDLDVLVGRRDFDHDYLEEMRVAASPQDVLGVAFNIPQTEGMTSQPYDASPGAFVPEVRCGLLDLERIRACRPLPNALVDGRLVRSWYRSLEAHQQRHGLRTLRGGDARTFYVHPPNVLKTDKAFLSRARDLVGQGRVPDVQRGQWDLTGLTSDWAYAQRRESIVFLIKGRDVGLARVRRCLRSLAMQEDSRFGIILIDDASEGLFPWKIGHLLKPFLDRCTLVRRSQNVGRIPNFRLGIRELCVNPEALVVVLDMDDALLSRTCVGRLRAEYERGCDVVLASMFRPDKPTKLYHPDFVEPRRYWGGEVWIHLRAFRKRLFDAIPLEDLQIDGRWIEQCTDYATMLPIVEACRKPMYIPEYLYFHERSTPPTPELRAVKDDIIRRILEKRW